MNKKFNTLLFVLGATLINILLMIILFLAAFVVYGLLLAPRLPAGANAVIVVVLFIVSIVGTYFIYHKLVTLMSKKVEFEKYFDPLFKPKRK